MLLNDNKLEFDKVVSKIGFPITFEDYRSTYKYDANIDKITEFESELRNNMGKGYNTVLDIIKRYKDIFDTELYFFHIGKYLEKDYKASKESEILKTKYYPHLYYTSKYVRPTIATIDYYNNMLKNVDVVDVGINSKTGELVIESSQELYGNKDLIKNSLTINNIKLEKIKSKIGLNNVLKYLKIDNIIDFCKYENLGNYLSQKLKAETLEGNDYYFEKYEELITKYIEYMDLDKMLIIANFYYYSKYNMVEGFTEYEINGLLDYTKNIEEIIDNKYDTFIFKTEKTIISFQSIKSSVNTLKKCFINGVFYTIDRINEISQKLLKGEIKIENVDKEIIRNSFSYTNSEFIDLLKNDYNFEYIIKNGYLTKDEVLNIYEKKSFINDYDFNRLYNFDIINNDYLLKKYMLNDISLDTIKYIKENTNKVEDFEKLVSNYELITLFISENQEDRFQKYQLLYKILILDNKSEDEKNIIGFNLINQVKELLDDCKIYDLYKLGLITKENFIGSINITTLCGCSVEGKISLSDLRELFDFNIITENMVRDYILDNNIELNNKIVFLYGLFPKDTDVDIRNNFLKEITNNNYNVNSDEQIKTFKSQVLCGENNIWTTLYKFDNGLKQKLLRNGYVLFYLPTKDLYIIEQLFYNQKMIYGTGTYIITAIEFYKNKELLIIDNYLNSSYLNSLYLNNKADKLISTGWVNPLNRYLENM